MWDEIVSTFLSNIGDSLEVAIMAVLTGFAGYIIRAIVKYITSKHLEKLAHQAVHFAEDMYKEFDGDDKLEAACGWVAKRLKKLHIKVDSDDIQEAVQSAYDYVKGGILDGLEEDEDEEDNEDTEDLDEEENMNTEAEVVTE